MNAVGSKLRGCDVIAVRVDDASSGYSMSRATNRLEKAGRQVRFELTDQARLAIDEHLRLAGRSPGRFQFVGRDDRVGLTTRQDARLVQEWVASIGLDPAKFGTHLLRRTKAVLIYWRVLRRPSQRLPLRRKGARCSIGSTPTTTRLRRRADQDQRRPRLRARLRRPGGRPRAGEAEGPAQRLRRILREGALLSQSNGNSGYLSSVKKRERIGMGCIPVDDGGEDKLGTA